jgi:hypothetical protein
VVKAVVMTAESTKRVLVDTATTAAAKVEDVKNVLEDTNTHSRDQLQVIQQQTNGRLTHLEEQLVQMSKLLAAEKAITAEQAEKLRERK